MADLWASLARRSSGERGEGGCLLSSNLISRASAVEWIDT